MCSRGGEHPGDRIRCRIIPTYVHEQIAINGSAEARSAALNTLLQDTTIRFLRATLTGGASHPAAAGMLGGARSIFDCQQQQVLPGELVRSEGSDPTDDVAVNEAYDGLGDTLDLLADAFGRNSIDGAGSPLLGSVHYDRDYDNAFWDGTQMVFGDGDGELFNRFTIALDVIGHELAHGVTEQTAGLIYYGQPGALNESVSDVIGSLVKQYALGQTVDEADWLIGAGLLTDAVQGVALRSMSAPGTAYDDPVLGRDPQPAHMSAYVRTTADNGGVHINSGIPNFAFYNTAMELGGFAWERAGQIWYHALTNPSLGSQVGFRAFAALTLRVARQLYGPGSAEALATRNGWEAAGIQARPTTITRRPGSLAALSARSPEAMEAPWRRGRGAAKRAASK
jgi:Zn-dependent metalloprotease